MEKAVSMAVFLFILLGLAAGTLSGIIGIGGGVFIVPALLYFFGFSQHEAQGTTLALLVPPVGILAAWTYYKSGYVNLKVAGLICLGFFVGGLVGAKAAAVIPDAMLRKVFGAALLLVSLKMILWK